MAINLDLEHVAPPPRRKDYRIGAIGAGFIMRDCHLAAYRNAGFPVVAITSASRPESEEAARARGIPQVYDTYQELLADPSIQVIDIAVPPDKQLAVVREAVKHSDHIKGILAQKPIAMNYADAKEIVRLCEQAGITLSVNQNMRYDHSIRALKTVLKRGYLGEPVLATIELRSMTHRKPWQAGYQRLTLLDMSIHHLDSFRYLFGEPESLYVSARKDPRLASPHVDGVVLYIVEYANGLRASAWDDIYAGPGLEGVPVVPYVKWRVEGTEGLAKGTIGWPSFPNVTPSTIDFSTRLEPGVWFSPRWKEAWFPDAFGSTMGQLLEALATGAEPVLNGRDNLKTMALIEAGYKSIEEHRPVKVEEM